MAGTETGGFGAPGARTAAGALAVLLVAGCGTAQDPEEAPSGSAGAYPLTVETVHGEVTVEREPERVVALGFAPAEELLALGVEPVSVAEDPDTLEQSVPWMAGEIADTADAGLLTADGEPNLETVAAADPDLIVSQTYQVTDQSAFDQLNAIAPTILPTTGAVNVDWDERLLKTAEALGRTAQAKELVTEIEAGTVYYADLAFANAINSAGPISLRWLAEELRPAIEELG